MRRHVAAYRIVVGLLPREHRDRHGRQQVEVFADLLASGVSPWRLWAGVVPDVVRVHASSPRAVVAIGANLVLVALSVAAVLVGSAVAGLAAWPGVPVWAEGVGAAVALQGAFALAWVFSVLPLPRRLARRLFVGGEVVALLVGGAASAVAVSRWSSSPDPEYGPLTLGVIVTVHAVVGLVVAIADAPCDAAPTAAGP